MAQRRIINDSLKAMSLETYQKITGGAPVVIEFTAKWCHPCKLMEPLINQLALAYQKKVLFYKIDIDDNKTLANALKVDEIPMFMMYRNAKSLWTHIGVSTQKDMEDLINNGLK